MIHAETSPRANWSPVSRSKVQGRYVGIARHAPEGDVAGPSRYGRCEGLDGFPLMGMLMCMLMCMSRPSQARKWIVSDDLQGLAPTNHRCRAAEPRPRCCKYRVLEGRIPNRHPVFPLPIRTVVTTRVYALNHRSPGPDTSLHCSLGNFLFPPIRLVRPASS